MKLIYKGLEFDVDQIIEDNYNQWAYYNSWNYQWYATSTDGNYVCVSPTRNSKIICRSKENIGLIQEVLQNNQVEQQALFKCADGDWEISDLQLSDIQTRFNSDGQFENTLTFLYSKAEFVPGSELGFFKE